jgi:hypothetical protein
MKSYTFCMRFDVLTMLRLNYGRLVLGCKRKQCSKVKSTWCHSPQVYSPFINSVYVPYNSFMYFFTILGFSFYSIKICKQFKVQCL